MMPAPSGTGYAIAVLVWFVLLVVGLIAIVVAVNQLTARFVGIEIGCVVGGVVGCAWVWLLLRIDDAPLSAYAAVMLGVPLTLTIAARATRSDDS